ncbi:zinc-ribbon domain-containing protein [Hyphococcus lacteus]|uniref:Zinc-ribbon domain-containing protein n=1 Tax=Hyphococcus lacteus TaxID=3143536 RepID=A0ABV3Z2I0_9PROT
MIITCPDCTTRYDVDDERFSPNGRSVRCSSCGESWFVPAPELIDVEPIKESNVRADKEKTERPNRRENSDRARIRVGVPKDDADHQGRDDNRKDRSDIKNHQESDHKRRNESDDDRDFQDRERKDRKSRRDSRDEEPRRKSYEDDEDDSLFVRPKDRVENKSKGRGDHNDDNANVRSRNDRDESRRSHRDRDEDDDVQEKGWRKGRQFIIEDEDDVENRPFFARKKKKERDEDRREPLRFGDDDYADERSQNDTREEERFSDEEDDIDYDVVDADWEDVGEDGPIERGFGRRIRSQRRRATALARLEDVRPLDPQALDDEFFAALKVTPRELETAIRKARRRAEARDKNRLTPFRAFGWAMWLFAVVGVLYVVVTYRDDIVKLAPGTADAYAVIGIDANPYGLAIDNVRHRLAMSTGGPTIEITGHLRNETDAAIDTPLLQAEALGARGELLARWTFAASEAQVSESGIVEFVTRAPAPDGVTEVALSFAPASSTVLDSLLPLNE